jgi:hypothetical protein
MRYYVRYESGFAFEAGNPVYTKDIYWNVQGTGLLIMGYQGGGWGVNYNGGTNYSQGTNWTTFFGAAASDGRWMCMEYHLKQNGASGIIQMWLDDTLVVDTTGDLGSTAWTHFVVGDNNSALKFGDGDRYTDIDDIVVDDAQRIGPISGGSFSMGQKGGIRPMRASGLLR